MSRYLGPMLLVLAACSSESTPIESPEADLSPLGGDRPVEPIVPESFDPTAPTPLVILLHGYGASGAANDLILDIVGEVDSRHFVYLRPDGTIDDGGKRFWNATDRCCDFDGSGVDDVAYISDLIAEAQARYAISRVALVGHSNGGFMTHRFACDRAELVHAFASIAGATWQDASRCQTSDGVAALSIHGTEDSSVLFDGNPGDDGRPPHPGAAETTARWAALNGCDAAAETADNEDFSHDASGAETEVSRHPGCDDGGAAELWKMVDEGHLPAFNDRWRSTLLDWLLGA